MGSSRLKLLFKEYLEPGSTLQLQWDRLVESSSFSGFMQSAAWAAFKRKQGFRLVHLLVIDDEENLIAGGTGYASTDATRVGWLVMPEGPLLPWEDCDLTRQCLQIIVEGASALSNDMHIMGLRIEPRIAPPVHPAMRSLHRAPFDSLPSQTLCLGLSPSEPDILAGMHHKCRYNIRVANRSGVTVRQGKSPAEIAAFYNVMLDCASRDDFFLEPLSFFSDLCETFSGGMARLFLAEHENEVLAALLMIALGDRATYLYGGTATQKRNLMAGYAVQWHAICEARAAGCKIYDFYGYVPPCDDQHPYARFSRFKHQFGGTSMRFVGAHDFVFTDRLTDAVIRALKELQSSAAPSEFVL